MYFYISYFSILLGPAAQKGVLRKYANNEDSDQRTQYRDLIEDIHYENKPIQIY